MPAIWDARADGASSPILPDDPGAGGYKGRSLDRRSVMRWYAPAFPVLACGVAGLACALPSGEDGSIQTSGAATLTSVAATVPTDTVTPEPTPTPAALPPRLWNSYSGG